MKYLLITKDPATQATISETEYKSLRKISQDLDSTYCSIYECFLLNEGEKKPPKKLSQVRFNKKYQIKAKA